MCCTRRENAPVEIICQPSFLANRRTIIMAIVVGDGTGATALVNLDGLVQFVCLRGKAVANALRLTKDGQLNRTVTACGNAGEVQEFVIKQLKGVFGDSDAKFFGAKKWELLETTPNGSCGFEARALIAGFRGIGDDGLMDALSQTMRDLFASHHGSKNQSWMDTIDLIQDLLVNDHRFDGRVFWIRTIATMHIEHAKCAVTMRANTFKMNGQVGAAWVEDAGAWPLAATPIEPPQPYHGARALNSVLSCAHRSHTRRRAGSVGRLQWPVHHLHGRDDRRFRARGLAQCAPHPGLQEHGRGRATPRRCVASTVGSAAGPQIFSRTTLSDGQRPVANGGGSPSS